MDPKASVLPTTPQVSTVRIRSSYCIAVFNCCRLHKHSVDLPISAAAAATNPTMDALTLTIAILVVALTIALAAVARYSIRPTSFEDALPGYGGRASVDRAATKKTSRKKKLKKNAAGSGPAEATKTDRNETETDEDTNKDDRSSGQDEDEDVVKRASKQKQEKRAHLLRGQDDDLLAYSRNFKSILSSKTKTPAFEATRSKQQVGKKSETKETAVWQAAAAPVKQSDDVEIVQKRKVTQLNSPNEVATVVASSSAVAAPRSVGQKPTMTATRQETAKAHSSNGLSTTRASK